MFFSSITIYPAKWCLGIRAGAVAAPGHLHVQGSCPHLKQESATNAVVIQVCIDTFLVLVVCAKRKFVWHPLEPNCVFPIPGYASTPPQYTSMLLVHIGEAEAIFFLNVTDVVNPMSGGRWSRGSLRPF